MPIDAEPVLDLIATPTPPELGPERREGTESLSALSGKIDLALERVGFDARNRELVRALVLLWHDHLDPAHQLAQGVEGADGAFVHGILHRREPDYGNAAYWFRRVGMHPVFNELRSRIAVRPNLSSFGDLERTILPGGSYDPFGFINLCERYARGPNAERELLREIQAIETRTLLEYFSKNSVGD